MNTATAYIDISRPSGRRIVSEIETKGVVKAEYPLPTTGQKTYTIEESFKMVEDILTAHYGVPIKSK